MPPPLPTVKCEFHRDFRYTDEGIHQDEGLGWHFEDSHRCIKVKWGFDTPIRPVFSLFFQVMSRPRAREVFTDLLPCCRVIVAVIVAADAPIRPVVSQFLQVMTIFFLVAVVVVAGVVVFDTPLLLVSDNPSQRP